MATLTIADLDNGKRDLQTVDAVANSQADTTTTRYGQQTLTLAGALRRLGWQAPVAYAPGLAIDAATVTVEHEGVVYRPDPSIVPFTTGDWDPNQWRVVQNSTSDHNLLTFDTYAAARAAAATLPDGQIIEAPDASGKTSRFIVNSGALEFQYFVASNADIQALGEEIADVSASLNDQMAGVSGRLDGLTPDSVYELSSLSPSTPTGQIANECAVVIPYGGAIYALFKGSYSLNDNSYITVALPNGDSALTEIQRVDLGIGADARAMAIHNGHLYVFCQDAGVPSIRTYRISASGLQLKHSRSRRTIGFVQSCRVIAGRLYGVNWGLGNIECYDLAAGVPSVQRIFTIGAFGNASIVSWGAFHYLLIWADTANIVKFSIRDDGSIDPISTHSFPGLVRPRYGVVENGVMSVGGYDVAASKTVLLNISGVAPVKIGEVTNLPTHVRVGKYLIGSAADSGKQSIFGKAVRIDTTSGALEVLSDVGMLYPVKIEETVFSFRTGSTPNPSGADPSDSKLGQKLSVFSTRKGVITPFIPSATPEPSGKSYERIVLPVFKSIAAGDILARWSRFTPNLATFIKVDLKYFIVSEQAAPGASAVVDCSYGVFINTAGVNRFDVPMVEMGAGGALTSKIILAVQAGELVIRTDSSISNAAAVIEIGWTALSMDAGAFIN